MATASRTPVLNADLAEEHHDYWNEQNIQNFWAGTSFYGPGEVNKLSYSLGEILVELIDEHWGDFLDFVKNADWRDGGQDAALASASVVISVKSPEHFWGPVSGVQGGRQFLSCGKSAKRKANERGLTVLTRINDMQLEQNISILIPDPYS